MLLSSTSSSSSISSATKDLKKVDVEIVRDDPCFWLPNGTNSQINKLDDQNVHHDDEHYGGGCDHYHHHGCEHRSHHHHHHHQCRPTSATRTMVTTVNLTNNIWPTILWLWWLLSIKSILNIQRRRFPTKKDGRRQRWPLSLRLNPVYNDNNNHHHHHHCCLYNCCFMLCTMLFLCLMDKTFAMNFESSPATTVVVATTAATNRLTTSANYPHNHHRGSTVTAEYFYAQDKLSDAQVEQFLQSLQNSSNNQANHNSNQSISSSSRIQHRVYPSLPPPAATAAAAASQQSFTLPHLLASRSTPSSSSSSSSASPSSQSSLIRRPLPPPTSTTSTNHPGNSFSLVTLATPPSNINIINSIKDNLTVAKYVRLPDHKSANGDEKYTDVSQWLRPVYVAPPKRASSSTMSNTNTPLATVSHTGNGQSNDQMLSHSHHHSDNIVLFGSTTDLNDTTATDLSVMFEQDSKNVVDDNGTLSKLFQNVTFELKDEQWVAPIIALSTLNMLVIFGFECFVVYRACRTCPSRRHLFLGQMLLLGLFLCSAMGLVFVPKPSWLSCSMIRAGLGLSYTLVYAALLVKTVFLLSLHTGVYLPAEYQALLLFFILATQVAIDAQWLVYWQSSTVIDYWDGFGHAVYRCDHSTAQLLWSLSYVILLIVILAIMTFRTRGYRENHGEALFLGIVAIAQIVVWLVWIAGTMTSTPHYRDGFVAFGVVGNATMIFVIMFLPKGRQMAAFGTGGRADVVGPGADQTSTTSSPSVYAPSFLNLKQNNFVALGSGKSSSIAGPAYPRHHSQQQHYGQQHHVQHHHSSIGKSGRSSSQANTGGYHLYQKFDALIAGNTNNNPTITTNNTTTTTTLAEHIGTNSSTHTQQNKYPGATRMSNSFSSHAILNSYQQPPVRSNSQDPQQQDLDDDPNYSNLSNIFTASTMAAVSSSNDGSKTSPLSENISISHCSSGGSSHSASHQQQQQSVNSSRPPSVPKSKRPNLMTVANGGPTTVTQQQQQLKSPNQDSMAMPPAPPPLPMARNAGGGFFYLQPPPLPPPPPPTTSNGMDHNGGAKTATSSSSRQQQPQPQSWRQSSCCTSSYGINNHHRHHYPGPKSGSYHPSLPPVPSTPTMGNGLTTPIGHVPPPQLISPQDGSIMADGCRSSTASAIGFYFTPQFDQQSITSSCNGGAVVGRKAGTPTTTTTTGNNSSAGQNFKYFRGNGHHY